MYAGFMSFGFIVVLMGYVSGWLGAALGPILGWEPLELMLIAGVITALIRRHPASTVSRTPMRCSSESFSSATSSWCRS